ncbi:MAG: hypothetical protein R3E68_22465 [Burkholderiaceae bacterium]
MFGAADKPQIVLRYDPSQAMVLPLVRGLLAQHAMEQVGNGVFSGSTPLLQGLREQVATNPGMPAQRRDELTRMFDSIAQVQAGTTPGASDAPGLSAPFSTREMAAGPKPGSATTATPIRSPAWVCSSCC